mgnify:CR=1 FL=1
MYQCPRCRTESPPDGEQNRRKVQQQGKGEIQADDMHHVAGKAQQKGKETDFIVDQNYIGRIHAMPLPTPPMAMPTAAFFRAGASLTPSPTMQTCSPVC